MKKIISYIIVLVVLTSCEKTIPIDVEIQDPKVVVNALFDNTRNLEVSVSRSAMIDNPNGPLSINDAEVNLYENGIFLRQLTSEGFQGLYTCTDTLQPDNTYRLDVSCDIGSVTVSNTVPEVVPVISVDSIVETQIVDDFWGESLEALMFYFTFQDKPGDQYYVIKVVREGSIPELGSEDLGYMFYYEYNYQSNASGIGDNSSVEFFEYLRFPDGLFDGELKTYKFGVEYDPYMLQEYIDEGYTFKLKFYSISEDFYNYLQTYDAYWNAEGNFFAENINLFSNVEGGLGIFAGAAMYEVELDMIAIITN